MAEEFNVNEYWLKRGKTYIAEQRLASEYHRLQENLLLEVLRHDGLPVQKILELGCGFGRITKLIAEKFPGAKITALDLSPDQLANARRYCAGCRNVAFEPYDFYSGRPFPGGRHEVAIAIEVFLHHPPEAIAALLRHIANTAEYIVNIDWSEEWKLPIPSHVWIHDYAKMYADIGLRTATFVLPRKIEGKQQRLFVAGKILPPKLLQHEREFRDRKTDVETTDVPLESWFQQLQLAGDELMQVIPPGSCVILVNDDQWGNRELCGRRLIPFLERDGRYWGPPADDETAIRELHRLRAEGAEYIVFAWNSFWWLDHYKVFHRNLRAGFPVLLENERLVVFKLND
jgi:SAM-dependent methyltransferase